MVLGQSRSFHRNARLCEFPIVVDKLKYLIRSPVVRHPLLLLAVVVRPPTGAAGRNSRRRTPVNILRFASSMYLRYILLAKRNILTKAQVEPTMDIFVPV